MSFQIAVGPNIRKSPYFDATVADGVASFSVYNHMFNPAHFGDPEGEYDRLINGVVMWDVDKKANPFELGLIDFVDLDQEHDFIGKAALKNIVKEGIQRRRVGLILSGDRISQNAHPTPVYLDGVVVGQLSETVYSQRIDKNIALALIQADIGDKQDGLAVDTGDGRRNAIIADLPFC